MTKFNARNERQKKAYIDYLKQALGKSENTIDVAAAAIDAFQVSTKYRDFGKFRIEQVLKLVDIATPCPIVDLKQGSDK